MDEHPNPYAAPKAELCDDSVEGLQTEVKLFKVSAVGIATFLGTPLAGGIIMAINFSRLGRRSAARSTVVITTLYTVVSTLVLFFIPMMPASVNSWIGIVHALVMHLVAKSYFSEDIENHQRLGGPMASTWIAVGIGFLTMLGIAVPLFLLIIFFPLEL